MLNINRKNCYVLIHYDYNELNLKTKKFLIDKFSSVKTAKKDYFLGKNLSQIK